MPNARSSGTDVKAPPADADGIMDTDLVEVQLDSPEPAGPTPKPTKWDQLLNHWELYKAASSTSTFRIYRNDTDPNEEFVLADGKLAKIIKTDEVHYHARKWPCTPACRFGRLLIKFGDGKVRAAPTWIWDEYFFIGLPGLIRQKVRMVEGWEGADSAYVMPCTR